MFSKRDFFNWLTAHETVTRSGQRRRHCRTDRQAGIGVDVPRQPCARLGAEHQSRRIVYLTLCAVSNYIRNPTRPEWIAHRDFTPSNQSPTTRC
jgi:hypothetical protein